MIDFFHAALFKGIKYFFSQDDLLRLFCLLLQADHFSLSGPEQGTLTHTKKGNSLLCQPEQELRLVKDIPQKASSAEAAFLKEGYTAKTLAISADKKRGGLHLATADVRADMTVEKIMRTKKF